MLKSRRKLYQRRRLRSALEKISIHQVRTERDSQSLLTRTSQSMGKYIAGEKQSTNRLRWSISHQTIAKYTMHKQSLLGSLQKKSPQKKSVCKSTIIRKFSEKQMLMDFIFREEKRSMKYLLNKQIFSGSQVQSYLFWWLIWMKKMGKIKSPRF